ncbi:MAG TPA: hypothetical protein VD930_13550 [Gemmatimonadales bacterium]|nr:hypothetical protein [Gemmatimonadales bacterium]
MGFPRGALPEQLHYRDDGCELAPRCLECPLPQCRYDLGPKVASALMWWAELRPLLAQGLSAEECAERMRVSRRTIYRLKRYAATRITLLALEGL